MVKFLVKISSNKTKETLKEYGKVGSPRTIHDIVVFETDLSKNDIMKISGVEFVEEEQFDEPDEVQENPASWFLSSASDTYPDYTYTRTGKGVAIYVLDSGIRTTHEDFKGRTIETVYSYDGKDFGGDVKSPNHGTMCASCAAGNVYGIAKEAKILNARYNWSSIESIKALDSILDHYHKNSDPAVLSMSFNSTSSLHAHSVGKLAKEGIVLVGSAANYDEEQPRWPARREDVIAVAACDENLVPSVWGSGKATNYGKEIDIWAGGSNGRSAHYKSDNSTGRANGTSSACPLVAGAVALILEGSKKLENYSQVAYVKDILISNSRKGVIDYSDSKYKGTPNRYVYSITNNKPVTKDVDKVKHESGTFKDKLPLIIGAVAILAGIAFLMFSQF